MAFKKDGEIKVFVTKVAGTKSASDEQPARYTVDDLVSDSEVTAEEGLEEDEEDVPK
jgi:hypothetical protein